MPYDPAKHHRRSIRLKGYDYSQAGLYFVTICVQGGLSLLGEIMDGRMVLNPAGQKAQDTWLDIPGKFPTVELDAFVVMPNHVHFVLFLTATGDDVGADPRVRPASDRQTRGFAPTGGDDAAGGGDDAAGDGQTRGSAPTGGDGDVVVERPTLSRVVQWYKSFTTARYRHGVRDHDWPRFHGRLWQRNYYEHIVRNERALDAIRTYIKNNPAQWEGDSLHPLNPRRAKFLG